MKKIALVLLVLFVASTFAFAQRNILRDYGANKILALKNELQLSASQIEQLQALQKEARKGSPEERKAVREARDALNKLLQADELDLKAIEAKLRLIANNDVKMKLSRIKSQQSAANILTGSQKNTLKKIVQQQEDERKKKREERRGKREKGKRN